MDFLTHKLHHLVVWCLTFASSFSSFLISHHTMPAINPAPIGDDLFLPASTSLLTVVVVVVGRAVNIKSNIMLQMLVCCALEEAKRLARGGLNCH